MSKNRFSKPTPDYTPKSKPVEKEVTLSFAPCIQCGKKITEGYYGRYEESGVCSKTCNALWSDKLKSLIDYVIVK